MTSQSAAHLVSDKFCCRARYILVDWLVSSQVITPTSGACSYSLECTDDDIRLLDGGVPSRGRIETCRNNKWAVLCQDLLTDTTASDVCNSLDYSPYGM